MHCLKCTMHYAPCTSVTAMTIQVSKEFMMSPNKLHLECSLDKELYYHGETISVNVHIQVGQWGSMAGSQAVGWYGQ